MRCWLTARTSPDCEDTVSPAECSCRTRTTAFACVQRDMIGKKVRTFRGAPAGSRNSNVLSARYLAFSAPCGLEIAKGIPHNTVAAASGNSGESAVAKSGGRLATTARLFVCTLLIAGAAAGRARAQRLELRAGAVISSALVEDAIATGASTVRATARPAPLLGTAVLLPLRPPFSLEAGAAYASSSLRAEDSSGSWNGQRLGVLQALIGIRYRLGARVPADSSAGPYLRGAVGAVHYSAPTRSILEAGAGATVRRVPPSPGDPDVPKGQKIRVMPLKACELTFKRLGYIPVSIPYAEAYSAIETGIADGQMGGPPFQGHEFRDVQGAWIQYNDFVETHWFKLTRKLFDSLTKEDQNILIEAAERQGEKQWQVAEAQDEEYRQKMAARGLKIITLPDAELEKIAVAIRTDVWPELDKVIGKAIMDIARKNVGVPVK